MILYVDETESPEYFIVTGLLVNSRKDIESVYKHFRKSVLRIQIPRKMKARIFTEFKSTLLDKDYKNVKIRMLEELNKIHHCVIYSCALKKDEKFIQQDKEATYIKSISRIAESCEDTVDVFFDRFRLPAFEQSIVRNLKCLPNVENVEAVDSQKEIGIQFADNLCSVIRLNRTGFDNFNFFSLIEKYVKEV